MHAHVQAMQPAAQQLLTSLTKPHDGPLVNPAIAAKPGVIL